MRVTVETIYENVDQEWLDWWLRRLAKANHMPGSTAIVEELKESGCACFASKDPTSDCTAKTTYRIEP